MHHFGTNSPRPDLLWVLILAWLSCAATISAETLKPIEILEGPKGGLEALVLVPGSTDAYSVSFGFIHHWSRKPSDGDLVLRKNYRDPSADEEAQGFPGTPGGLVISSDNRFLYTLNSSEYSFISTYSRNSIDGSLQLIACWVFQDENRRGKIALTPDGAHLYAGGADLSIFSRHPVTGGLSELDGISVGATEGLSFSSDGSMLLHAGGDEKILRSFRRDPVDGSLTELDRLAAFGSTTILSVDAVIREAPGSSRYFVLVEYLGGFNVRTLLALVHADSAGQLVLEDTIVLPGQSVIASSLAVRADSGEVAVGKFEGGVGARPELYRVTPGGSELELLDAASDDIEGATALAFSPGGDQLYTGSRSGRSLTVRPVTGSPGALQTALPNRRVDRPSRITVRDDLVVINNSSNFYQAKATSIGLTVESATARNAWPLESVVLSPDGAHLYAADLHLLDSGAGSVYSRQPSGLFELSQEDGGFAGPLTLSPDGAFAFYPESLGENLIVASRDAVTGSFSAPVNQGIDTSRLQDLRMTPDGEYLLAVDEDFITAMTFGRLFKFDASAMTLTEIALGEISASEAEAFVASPDGDRVYSLWRAADDELSISVLERSEDSLRLLSTRSIGGVETEQAPKLAIEPGGRYLYASNGEGWLGAFGLDPATGHPTLLASFEQGVNAVDWLGGCCLDLAASADRLYVTNSDESTVVTLSWNTLFADGFESGTLSAWSVSTP